MQKERGMGETSSSTTFHSIIHSVLDAGTSAPIGEISAAQILSENYELIGQLSALSGERDENFWVKTNGGDELVFKVFGLSQPQGEADLLAAVLEHLKRNAFDLPVPHLIRSRDGRNTIRFADSNGHTRYGIVYSFLPGKPLIDARRSPSQHCQCGTLLARTAIALGDFVHPAMYRPMIWDLRNLTYLNPLVEQLDELPFKDFIRAFVDEFANSVSKRLDLATRQFVHNDFNARNIIVDTEDDARITGVIDFGDAAHTARIADVAVGVIGQLSAPQGAEHAMHAFIEAYQEVSPLDAEEMLLLPWLVAGRIVQNVILTSWYRSRRPDEQHFAAFGPEFFAWRIEFAKQLRAQARSST